MDRFTRRGSSVPRDTFDYGDLERVAKETFTLVWNHYDVERLEWEAGWNKSRVLLEAVTSVAYE